jgi:serine/threonine protein kinase
MSLIGQAATALHHAHLSGLVHRDVRPEHLVLRADGSVAIIDAGLAPGWWHQPSATRWAARAPAGPARWSGRPRREPHP